MLVLYTLKYRPVKSRNARVRSALAYDPKIMEEKKGIVFLIISLHKNNLSRKPHVERNS